MLREGKIGVFEAISVVLTSIVVKVFFASPRQLTETVGPAGRLVHVIAVSAALVGFLLISLLMKRFSGQDLVSVLETVFGKIAGNLISLILAAVILFNAVLFTREFSEAVKAYIFPSTPPSMIMIFFLAPVLLMSYLGFESLVKTVSSFVWIILISFISILILSGPQYNFSNLFPLFDGGIGHVAITALNRTLVYGDILVLTVFINSLQGFGHFKKAGLTAVIISGLFLISGFLAYNMSFPRSVASENAIPAYAITRAIEFGTFFQRFDPIYVFIWSISAMLAVGVNLYAFISIYCKVFRIEDQKPLVLPLGIILFSIGILMPSTTVIVSLLGLLRSSGWSIYFGIPLLALLIAAARGKRGVKSDAQ